MGPGAIPLATMIGADHPSSPCLGTYLCASAPFCVLFRSSMDKERHATRQNTRRRRSRKPGVHCHMWWQLGLWLVGGSLSRRERQSHHPAPFRVHHLDTLGQFETRCSCSLHPASPFSGRSSHVRTTDGNVKDSNDEDTVL